MKTFVQLTVHNGLFLKETMKAEIVGHNGSMVVVNGERETIEVGAGKCHFADIVHNRTKLSATVIWQSKGVYVLELENPELARWSPPNRLKPVLDC